MNRVAVIEDGTIFRMVSDASLAKEIPCLTGKTSIFRVSMPGGCSPCAQKRAAQKRAELNRIKTCLAGLSPEKRAVLKLWLGADHARVIYTNNAGQVVQVNF
jgi:hypothetical protein